MGLATCDEWWAATADKTKQINKACGIFFFNFAFGYGKSIQTNTQAHGLYMMARRCSVRSAGRGTVAMP